jgi:hypothetical protein
MTIIAASTTLGAVGWLTTRLCRCRSLHIGGNLAFLSLGLVN